MNKYLLLKGIIASFSLFLILAVACPRQAYAQPNNPPVITGANGFPNSGGIINGLETCQNTPLYICVAATDPDGDGLNLSSVLVTTGSGATITDAVPGDLCFTYNPLSTFSGADQLEVIVCDDAPGSLCDTVLVNIAVLPITPADAGPDDSSCPGTDVISMSANAPGIGESGVWSIVGWYAGVTINQPTNPNTTLTLDGRAYGTATLVWSISSSQCATSDTVIITNCGGETPVSANRGGNDTVWLESCYTLYQSFSTDASYAGFSGCGGTTHTWNVISGPNIPYTPNYNNPNATFSNLIEGTYTLDWCVSGLCVTGCDRLTIIVPAPAYAYAYAGVDAEVCNTDSYSILDASASNYAGLSWVTSGDGAFNNTTVINPTYTPGPNDILLGSATLSVTALGTGTCPDSTDSMVLTLTPPATSYAGADGEICEVSSYLIADASATNYDTLYWITSGTGSFSDTNAVNPTYFPSPGDILDGTVLLTLNASNGMCSLVSDNMILTITAQPAVFAGADAEICETAISYTIVDATATDYASLLWTSAGDGTFDDATILNPEYTPGPNDIIAGTLVLTLTSYGNGSCTDAVDDMTLSITLAPTAFAGADAEICETGLYQIPDAVASNYSSLLWTSSGSGSFNDPSLIDPLYTPSLNDINDGFVVLTLTAYGNGSCAYVSDAMTLTISSLPAVYAGADAEICETAISYTIADATASDYASLLWASSGDGAFDDAAILNPEYTPGPNDIAAGTLVLSLTAYGNGSCADAVDDMTLSISLAPAAFAGADAEICETSVSYTIADATATEYASLLWTSAGDGTFDDASLQNPTYTAGLNDLGNGSVVLTLTAYGNGSCADAVDDMTLSITIAPGAYAGADAEICETSVSYAIADATATDYASLLWTSAGDGTFDDATILNPEYTPGPNDITAGTVVLTLTAYGNGSCADAVDDMTLSITLAPTAFAGADAEICETSVSYTIADATATEYASLLWTSAGDGTFDDAAILNPTYTPGLNDLGNGSVVLTLTSYGNGSCTDAVDDMTLSITIAPGAFAGADAEICETAVSYILADATASDYASLLWATSGDGAFDDAAILNPEYTPGPNDIIAGTLVLTLTAYGNGSCADAVDDMTLSITLAPTAFAGADAEICETSASYAIADATATGYASLLWTSAGDGTFDDATLQNPTYTPGLNDLVNGSVVLTLTAYGNGSCTNAVDDMTLSITIAPGAYAGADAEICETDVSYILADATASDYASLLWVSSGDGAFDDATILNPEYTPGPNDITAGTLVLTLTAYGSGSCADAVDDMILSITLAPTVFAGADAEICETSASYAIADATATDYASLLWTSAGDGTFDDATLQNPTYTPGLNDLINGSVVLTLTAYGNGSCTDAVDDMTLSITIAPGAYAGADAEICETALSYILADATASDYASLLWVSSGDGAFDDAAILNPEYTPGPNDITAGTLVLTLTAYGNGSCADAVDDMTLSITLAPTVFAGADAEICETGLYQIPDALASNYSSLLWTSSGSGSFNDPSLIDPLYTPSQTDINDGFVVLTLTAYGNGSCADESDAMTLSITNTPAAYAGADAQICETQGSYILADATATEYSSVLWTTSGDGSFDDASIINPTYTVGPNDIVIGWAELVITAFPNGSCVAVTDTMLLSISLQPTAFAGPDDEICETQTYTLSSAVVTNETSILWTTTGTGTFDDATAQNPIYTPSISDILLGQVLLSVTAYGDGICPDATDEMILTIWNLALVYAGADATVCENEDYHLLDATADYYTALLWTTSGDGTFDDDAVLNPIYTPGTGDIASGTVLLTLTATPEGVCPVVSDDMTLSITLAPTVFAGADAEICEYDTYEILDATASNYSSLLWTTAGDGAFNDPALLNPVYTPGPGDIILGYAGLTLTAYGNSPCGDISDVMMLTITTAPIVFAGPDDEICETAGSYTLADATASDYAGLLWTSSGDGTFDADDILNPTYFPGTGDITAGLVTLTITAYGNGSCLDESDDMALTITLAPVAYAGSDAEICETDTFNLVDATAGNYASLLWSTSGDGTFSDATALNPTYYPGTGDMVFGSAFLSLTAFGNGSCADSTDTMLLTITPAPYANAGIDAQICETETYVLTDADAENYASLLWTTSGDGTFNDPTMLHPEYFPGITDIINGGVDLALAAYGLGSCDDASDTMTLNISPLPEANAGPDGQMCSSQTIFSIMNASAANYTSLLWTTNGTGTFYDNTVINPVYVPSQSDIENGQVVLTLTAYGDGYCPDIEDFMVLSIWKAAEVYAGSDAETCENNDYWILDAWAENYESLLWTTTGDGTYDDTGILSPVYTPGSNDIVNEFVYLVLTADGMGSCPSASDTLLLTITTLPSVDAGLDGEICESGVFPLAGASASNYSSLMWSTSGDGNFDDPNIIDPVYTPGSGDINTGSVVLTLAANGNGSCGDDSDELLLIINWEAYANTGTGGAGETCEGNTFFFMDAYSENYTQITWTTTGDGTFDDPNTMKPVYTPGTGDIAAGTVSITMTVVGLGICEDDSDSMELAITEAALALAGEDANICEMDNHLLADASASGFAMVTWSTAGDGSFDDPNAVNPTYFPGGIDISSGGVILTITAIGNGSCEDVSDEMSLQIFTFPTAEAGESGMICYGDEYQISDAEAQNYSELLWTTSGDGTFSDVSILEPAYLAGPADLADGYVVLTLSAYGYGSCGAASDTVVIGVNATPVANAGADQSIPEGGDTQLFGSASGGSGDFIWHWTPGDYIINSDAQNPTTFPIFQDTYFVLTVIDNLTGCKDSDTVLVEIEGAGPGTKPVLYDDYDTTFVNIPVVISALDNDIIPEGVDINVSLCKGPQNGIVTINSDNTFTYSPYSNYVGEDSLCYVVCTDEFLPLCDTAMIYIHILPLDNIEDNIIVYNGITPNGDGINDSWKIAGIENYPDNDITIFNRWGSIVKELHGYDNVNVLWNGTYEDNRQLSDGTYYYVIRIMYQGQEKYYKGWIYIHGSVK